MKILIVDGDESAGNLIGSKLKNLGHEVFQEKTKNDAVGKLSSKSFDVIFLDPAPLVSPRSIILDIRRNVRNYPYVFVTAENYEVKQALQDGVNDIFPKPFQVGLLEKKIANAERFIGLVRRLGDDSEDFPSAGGVIAKSAFNQLFLSGIDRADRYGEHNFVLLISIKNYEDLLALDGNYGAEYAVAKLSQHLVLIRRQSDIIGQTGKNEYGLLLQRSQHKTEPVEAAQRFVQSLAELKITEIAGPIDVQVSLIHVPAGIQMFNQTVRIERSEESLVAKR